MDRVIIVTDNAHVNGGSGKVAISSAIALHRHGIATTVFAAVGPTDPSLAAEEGLEVICTGQQEILNDPNRLAAGIRGVWNVTAREAMQKRLATADPRRTVVHIHSWTKALSSSVVAAAVESGFPVVVTLHEYFTACPLGSFFDHQRNEICTVAPLGGACLTRNCDPRSGVHKAWRVARHVVQKTVGHVPSGVHHFITISNLSEGVLRPYLPADAVLHPVLNPVDVTREFPVAPAQSKEYTFIGRLSQEKGVTMFARAAQRSNIQAIFVGEGECADDVLQACPSAEITGWVEHAEAMARVRGARAIVLPSLWYENAPLVVLEAAAMGVPCLVPDTCAARESIVEGVTGLTFRGGSEDDLVAKLALLRDDAFVKQLGENAYQRYWQRPQSMANHVEALLSVYDRILTGTAPVRRPTHAELAAAKTAS